MSTFERYESEVRGYCRSFPTTFDRAEGSYLFDTSGKPYLDFLSGAGVLSYGHNNPHLKRRLVEYIERHGVTHSLDLHTVAKQEFLERLEQQIIEPRGLSYKVQFPGPTGTNAVEAALKLARKVTGRQQVMAFTNGFHGMTLGALALTGNEGNRAGAGVPLQYVTHVPFDGYLGHGGDSLDFIDSMLSDKSSGLDHPAAAIVETVQAEGGVNPARFEWLRGLARILSSHDVLLIVDDIQVGCGRTGPFFSFEPAEIEPDIVCLSKALSGFGLPLSVVLMKPALDVWSPGEHNGTFRGHNLAFVTATAAIDRYWTDNRLTQQVAARTDQARQCLEGLAEEHTALGAEVRGRGLIQGLACDPETATDISRRSFESGLIVETAGPEGEVVKLLPPLTIDESELDAGLEILSASVAAAASAKSKQRDVA